MFSDNLDFILSRIESEQKTLFIQTKLIQEEILLKLPTTKKSTVHDPGRIRKQILQLLTFLYDNKEGEC